MILKKFARFVFFALLLAPIPALPDESIRQKKLFQIDRSKNASVVRYDVRLLESGFADPEEPVVGYWKKANGTEPPIKWYQKPAYGFDAECQGSNCAEIRIEMVPEIGRSIRAVRIDGAYRAIAPIDGRDAYLERVYVKSLERRFRIPKVLHIDFEGIDLETGGRRQERFEP